jgi:hypothetical protein
MYLLWIICGLSLFWSIIYMMHSWNTHTLSDGERGFLGKIWLCFYAPTISFIVSLMIVSILISIFNGIPEKKLVEDGAIPIVAMKDKTIGEGNFTLGCGTIDGVSYYFFYQKLNNGGYKQGKVKADVATIFETNSKLPRIQYYKYEFVNKELDKWMFPPQNEKVNIYVPVGSVKQNYTFNLE